MQDGCKLDAFRRTGINYCSIILVGYIGPFSPEFLNFTRPHGTAWACCKRIIKTGDIYKVALAPM
ncbi:hypothetical protein NW801_07340 [Brevibacillus laterosporus]|uniref:Uncharacterized protein n=1 Tax=Brevibacillus halotolerans TaxID=1507437 RepID=A0ABT4HWM1_9BACL|nr:MULTISPECIES: hypothetical protein [Brevibacillus]MCR8984887.1 hypothetical protein [Brevibacillus laterosporus]MCZ0830615.1 hypothetical protein [Brevibacillus halotolerans]